ncbi:MAG: hypothetical protein U9P70_01135, partial [Patescibacteria group bacterium]|nr:hypothetical protein [Patescibacteria group bacterium]
MKKIKEIKAVISFSLIIGMVFTFGYMSFEPEIVGAATDDITVTQGVAAELSIISPGNISMSVSIPGITGNPGSPTTGSATWNVKTSNATGFDMKIKASTDPALQLDGSNQFTDYSPVGTVPDFTWASPAASAAEFGFTVEAATPEDNDQKFLDDATDNCGAGTDQTSNSCWFDFNGATDV